MIWIFYRVLELNSISSTICQVIGRCSYCLEWIVKFGFRIWLQHHGSQSCYSLLHRRKWTVFLSVITWRAYVLVCFCSTLNCKFRWIQQSDGLYPLWYFFYTWHRQYALVRIVHIPSHISRVQHVKLSEYLLIKVCTVVKSLYQGFYFHNKIVFE